MGGGERQEADPILPIFQFSESLYHPLLLTEPCKIPVSWSKSQSSGHLPCSPSVPQGPGAPSNPTLAYIMYPLGTNGARKQEKNTVIGHGAWKVILPLVLEAPATKSLVLDEGWPVHCSHPLFCCLNS